MANANLTAAKKAQKDEFYTRRQDIENELHHYADHFRGKTVYCNCDDPEWSEFWQFFVRNFKPWGLKKLISTHYERGNQSYGMTFDGENAEYFMLESDGDFRSPESIELLKEADIVVTNPPFSLFREYVPLLMKYDKKFLIIGSQNMITYKEIFPLLKENRMWLGFGFEAGNAYFRVPDDVDTSHYANGVYNKATGLVKFRNCCWFTNLDHKKRHEPLDLRGNYYDPEKYPKYKNYDVIEVGRIENIPCDYSGVMGVPVTFMGKYCPDQFEIIGMAEDNGRGYSGEESKWDGLNPHCVVDGKNKFKRLFVRRKQ